MKRLHKSRPQYMEKSRKRLPLSAYLGYLLVCTLVFTGVSFAKFATTSTGSDSARVAAFVVSAAGEQNNNLTIDCADGNMSDTYTFTVSNNKDGKTAEVAMKYDLVITLPEALPDGLAVTLDGKTGAPSGTNITFANAGSFTAAKGETQTHTLTVTVDPDVITDDITLENISVNVIAEQID